MRNNCETGRKIMCGFFVIAGLIYFNIFLIVVLLIAKTDDFIVRKLIERHEKKLEYELELQKQLEYEELKKQITEKINQEINTSKEKLPYLTDELATEYNNIK